MMKPSLFLIFNNPLIHSMPHRTWIPLIDWFIDRLISWLINCPVDCLPDWMNKMSEANERDDEVDDPSDRSTDRPWFSDEGSLNDDCSTRSPSDDPTWDLSDGPTESPSDDPSECSEFSVMGTCSEFSVVKTCSEFSVMRTVRGIPLTGGRSCAALGPRCGPRAYMYRPSLR
jgi:hypothetical protein